MEKNELIYKYMEKLFWYHYSQAQKLQCSTSFIDSTLKWAGKVLSFFDNEQKRSDKGGDKTFLRFYLSNMKVANIYFLSVNTALLLVSIYVITQKEFGAFHIELDSSFQSYYPAVVEIGLWILLSSMCLAYFIILQFKPQVFATLFLCEECDVWYELAAAILSARVMILIVPVLGMLTSGASCIDAVDLISVTAPISTYAVLKGSVDVYQAFAFAMLPFPQPWSMVFLAVELSKQLLRLHGCTHRFGLEAEDFWIVRYMSVLLIFTYAGFILLPAMYLENSVRNSFKSAQQRQQAEASKREMVEFLSSDVRVPLQYMLYVIETVDFLELSRGTVGPLLASIHKNARVLNEVADDLLLMTCMLEDRYTSRATLVPDLFQLTNEVVGAVSGNRGVLYDSHKLYVSVDGYASVVRSAGRLLVDQKCFVAVLRHLLTFLIHGSFHATAGDEQRSVVSESSVDGSLDYHRIADDSAGASAVVNAPHNIKVTLLVPDPRHPPQHQQEQPLVVTVVGYSAAFMRTWSAADLVHESTTAYLCHTIASRCGGSFEASGGVYTLLLPCSELQSPVKSAAATYATAIAEHNPSKEPLVVLGDKVPSSDSNELTTADTLFSAAGLPRSVEAASACAIVSDPMLQSVIKAILVKMRLADDLTLLSELPVVGSYVPRAKLTFVTSYKLCAELRGRGYSGLIVLFSGSSNYLDPHQATVFNYCLPLPCTNRSIDEFMLYLAAAMEMKCQSNQPVQRKRNNATLATAGGDFAEETEKVQEKTTAANQQASRERSWVSFTSMPAVSVLKYFGLSRHRVNQALRKFYRSRVVAVYRSGIHCMEELYGLVSVIPIPPQLQESYMTWKLVNPAWSVHHPSCEMLCLIALRLVMMGMEASEVSSRLTTFYFIVVAIVMAGVGHVHKMLLEPCGVRLHVFWFLLHVFAVVVGAVTLVMDSDQPATTARGLTMHEFMRYKFDNGLSGAHVVIYLATGLSYMRMNAYYGPHPVKHLIIPVVVAVFSNRIWKMLIAVASWQLCQFIQLIFVQVAVLNMIYLVYLENAYRREFLAAHDHILSKAFIDQCLHVCQHEVRKPLQALLEHQNELWLVLAHVARARELVIDAALMTKLEPLHLSRLLLSEMRSELEYDSTDAAPMQLVPVQLPRAVAELISGFYSSSDEVNVRIYAEVDTKLSVVLVDWKMLSVILTNMLNIALKNIRAECSETQRKKDFQHKILVKFVSLEAPANVAFVHPRSMLVNVCDESDAATKSYKCAMAYKTKKEGLELSAPSRSYFGAASAAVANVGLSEQRKEHTGVTDFIDGLVSRYGHTVCEKLVNKYSIDPLFQTICPAEGVFKTVQRFTFVYRESAQTHKAYGYVSAEATREFVCVSVLPSMYHYAYSHLFSPPSGSLSARLACDARFTALSQADKNKVRAKLKLKTLLYLNAVVPEQRQDAINLRARIERGGWHCSIKYLLGIPRMSTLATADCLLIDQQLEQRENVMVDDLVLKLRVCGFNGVIAVLLRAEGVLNARALREELKNSAARPDLYFEVPIRPEHIQMISQMHEKTIIRHLLFLNSN
jgi:signal transduction histidine kinase